MAPMRPISSATGMKVSGGIGPRVGMRPARERLDADGPAGPQLDHGLVGERQLAALERVAQVGLELDARQQRGAHRALVGRERLPPAFLARYMARSALRSSSSAPGRAARHGRCRRWRRCRPPCPRRRTAAHRGDDPGGDPLGRAGRARRPRAARRTRRRRSAPRCPPRACTRARRAATARSSSSPAAWPMLSLTDLKRSRSTKSTHRSVSRRAATSSACCRRSRKSARLGSPVSESWKASSIASTVRASVSARLACSAKASSMPSWASSKAAPDGRHRDERTGAGAVDVDRRRQGRLDVRRGADLRRRGGDDGELGLRPRAAGGGRGDDRAIGVQRIVEHERDRAAAEQSAGARGDRGRAPRTAACGARSSAGCRAGPRAGDGARAARPAVRGARAPGARARRPACARSPGRATPRRASPSTRAMPISRLRSSASNGASQARDEQAPGPVAVPAGDRQVTAPQAGELEHLVAGRACTSSAAGAGAPRSRSRPPGRRR